MGDKHHFLIEHHAFSVPVGNLTVKSILGNLTYGALRCIVGIDNGLEQRIAGQTVATVQTCASTFAGGIEIPDRGLAVAVNLDTPALVVCRRTDGYHVFGNIDTQLQALGIDGRESVYQFVLADTTGIEIEVVDTGNLHLIVDGTCHDVAWSQ